MWRLALIATALLAASASAQAPSITPAGDPSVQSDTIYKLAVNPADYPDQVTVWLLDDGDDAKFVLLEKTTSTK